MADLVPAIENLEEGIADLCRSHDRLSGLSSSIGQSVGNNYRLEPELDHPVKLATWMNILGKRGLETLTAEDRVRVQERCESVLSASPSSVWSFSEIQRVLPVALRGLVDELKIECRSLEEERDALRSLHSESSAELKKVVHWLDSQSGGRLTPADLYAADIHPNDINFLFRSEVIHAPVVDLSLEDLSRKLTPSAISALSQIVERERANRQRFRYSLM